MSGLIWQRGSSRRYDEPGTDPTNDRATAMNRAELQQLAQERIRDAKVLLAAKQWSAAYYLAGYAVECALKSCILAFIERTGFIFVEKKYAEQCWTHDLEVLLKLAGLEPGLGAA